MRPSGPARIIIYGEYGIENLGNDATLRATTTQLAEAFPQARLAAVCVHPEVVAGEHGIEALPMHVPAAPNSAWVGARILRKLSDPWWCWRLLKGSDALIVAGTGILEDTSARRAWQTPWSLFGAVVAARARRARVVFLDVGVAPATSRAKRLLYGTALRLAGLRTYRDDVSRRSARTLGVDTTHDQVYPDLYFGQPRPARAISPTRTRSVVAIGAMAYAGSDPDLTARQQFTRRYVDVLADLAVGLVESGVAVRLVIGESNDLAVGAEVARRVEAQCGHADGTVDVLDARDLATVSAQLAAVDAAVVTRYHNIIAAIHAGVPTVAICYGPKSRALLDDVGLADLAFDIADVDAAQLRAAVDRVLRDGARIEAQLVARVEKYPPLLDQQLTSVVDYLRGDRAARA